LTPLGWAAPSKTTITYFWPEYLQILKIFCPDASAMKVGDEERTKEIMTLCYGITIVM